MAENHPAPDKRAQSGIWSIILGLAAASIVLAFILLGAMILVGGLTRIGGWYLMQLIPPALGLLALLLVAISIIARRGLTRLAALVGVLGLVALLPLVMLVRPVAFPADLEATEPAATVRLPADVPLTVAWGGDSIATNYHAATPDQRWAYDLLVEPYLSGSDDLAGYGCYGVTVVAPAAGVVAAIHDGEPDATPGVISNNLSAPAGNYVAIRLETDSYLLIAHLKPGSVLVAEGESVEEGQPIGQCGNSGNTSEPHIHIHHQRQNPADVPINFAEGLPLYFRDHVDQAGNPGPAMPEGGIEPHGEGFVPVGPTLSHQGE